MKQNLFDYITRIQPTPVELSKTPPTVRNYIKLLEKAIIAEIKIENE